MSLKYALMSVSVKSGEWNYLFEYLLQPYSTFSCLWKRFQIAQVICISHFILFLWDTSFCPQNVRKKLSYYRGTWVNYKSKMLFMVHISLGKIIVTYLIQHLFLEQVVGEGNLFLYLKWKFYLRRAIEINRARVHSCQFKFNTIGIWKSSWGSFTFNSRPTGHPEEFFDSSFCLQKPLCRSPVASFKPARIMEQNSWRFLVGVLIFDPRSFLRKESVGCYVECL